MLQEIKVSLGPVKPPSLPPSLSSWARSGFHPPLSDSKRARLSARFAEKRSFPRVDPRNARIVAGPRFVRNLAARAALLSLAGKRGANGRVSNTGHAFARREGKDPREVSQNFESKLSPRASFTARDLCIFASQFRESSLQLEDLAGKI